MKAIQLLVNSVLPDELKNYEADFSEKGLNKILYAVATKYPERFADVLQQISDIGRKVSYQQGETLTLEDLAPVIDRQAIYDSMDREIAALPKDKDFTNKRREIFQKYNTFIEKETSKNALANRNNIAISVLSGARGKSAQLKAMISTPGTFSDYKGTPIDVFSKESFSDGIRPVTFLASTYGARSSVISTKSSTAKGGDLAKQMAQSVVDMVIRKHDCGSTNGISLNLEDESLKGRVLSKDVGGFKEGQFITRQMIHDLQKQGITKVIARSPLTCNVENGLCAACVGKFYNGGKLPKIGDSLGAAAATALSEPITQMALCIAGFEYVNRPDGSKIRIRNVEVGQEVCAADKHGHITSAKVLNVFDQGVKMVRTFTFESILDNGRPILHEDGSVSYTPAVRGQFTVTCTEDHKFLYTDGTVAPIKDIYESGKLNKILLMEDMRPAVLIEASEVFEAHCYDIEIDHPDHLFVLSSGFICSNSAKHTAGMTQSKKTYSGLGTITQFTQSPEKFKDKAAVSELDGIVEDVAEAPQGGFYVTVSGKKHYVPAGHDVEVKVGDEVEAGDFLSEGLGDPEDIVKHKGLGAGRLYYANRLNQILADSGAKNDKRSTEILARGALRHVRVTEDTGYGNYLPDDIVDYNTLQGQYRMTETTRLMKAKDANGKYLQAPILHYTIGTKITPKVIKDLSDNDLEDIYVDDNEPAFKPEMIRIRAASHTNPDWMASLGTSYLTKQLNESSTKADDTNVLENTDYRPRLAFGKDFGKNIEQTGLF